MEKGINGLNGEPQGSPYGRDRVAWWLRSPGLSDLAACVFGEPEGVLVCGDACPLGVWRFAPLYS